MGCCYDRSDHEILEGFWWHFNFGLERPLSSVGPWKVTVLKADDGGQPCEASEGSFESPLKTILGPFRFWIQSLWSSEAEEPVMIKKISEPLKGNLCFAGITNTGQRGLKSHLWLRRDQHHSGETFWDVFPQRQHTSCVPEGAKVISCSSSRPWQCVRVSFPGDTGFEGMRNHGEQPRLGETRRGQWWRWRLSCRSPRTEGVLGRRWGLEPWGRVRIPKQSPRETTDEGAAQRL